MSNANSHNLGPLPISDRNSEIQELSFRAFDGVLPVDKFKFRQEPKDFGVDCSLELLIDGCVTNFRAQVQLKGTDSREINQDGSVSISVKVENLNYLLNGPNPLYVLYVVPRNELRYAWAREEVSRVEQANHGWREQETVTIRFQHLLTHEAVEQIHQRILGEEQMRRRINDLLGAASNIGHLAIRISPETLRVTSPQEAKEILLKSGTLIITAGYFEEARSLLRLLDSETERNPRILLIKAYAEHLLGKYLTANGFLSEAVLRENELSDDDKQLLQLLRRSCEYNTGRITLQEFSGFLDAIPIEATGHFAESFRLNQLYFAFLSMRDAFQRPDIVSELRALVEKILSESNTSVAFKLHAKSIWLEVEGNDMAQNLLREIARVQILEQYGWQFPLAAIFQSQWERFIKWEGATRTAIIEAEQLGHKPLLASITLIKSTTHFLQLLDNKNVRAFLRQPVVEVSEPVVNEHLAAVRQAMEIFRGLGDREGEVRAALCMADFYEFSGRIDAAQQIAQEALPKAEAMCYERHISHAKDLLAGNGFSSQSQQIIAKIAGEENEKESVLQNANKTDEEIDFLANQRIRMLGLPVERLPIVKKLYYSTKALAQEQLDWCKHIELIEDDNHAQSPQTFYKIEPSRKCVCKLHRYKSTFEHQDWEALFVDFKQTFCDKCNDRKPIR